MGGVSSVPSDSTALFLRDPNRFFIQNISISVPNSPPNTFYNNATSETLDNSDRHIISAPGSHLVLPNYTGAVQTSLDVKTLTFNTTSLDPKRLVEYIQDPDPRGNFPFLPKLPPYSVFKFQISIATPPSQPVSNLTFIVAPTVASLDNLLLNEFLDNPNIQNEENVFLLGDFTSSAHSPSTTFEFVWKSFPLFNAPAFRNDERGSKFIFCFAEYDKRDHSLKQLARFAVWIDSPSSLAIQAPQQPQPKSQQQFAFLPKINTGGILEPLPEVSERDSPTSPLKRDATLSPDGPPPAYPPRLGSVSPNISKYNSLNIPNYPPSSPDSIDQYSSAFTDGVKLSRRSSEADIYNAHTLDAAVSGLASNSDLDVPVQSYSRSASYSEKRGGPEQASNASNASNANTTIGLPITSTTSHASITSNASSTSGVNTPLAPNPPFPLNNAINTSITTEKAFAPSQVVSSLILPDFAQAPQPLAQQPIVSEPSTNHGGMIPETKEKPTLPRPAGDSVQQSEDGPVFRAQIADFEKRTSLLKAKFKKLLKRSITVHERQSALMEAHVSFLQAIQDTADTDNLSFQPLIQSYFNNRSNSAYFALNLLRKANSDLHEHVIEPARRLYEQEIKSFDQRKKEFDEESREYYAWLSRYLSVKQEAKGKKKSDSDSKYLDKKRAFELCRFDYFSYLHDLHGGRKQQMVTYHLALFAEAETSNFLAVASRIRNNNKCSIDNISSEAKEANKEWTRHRAEREVHRRAIERSSKDSTSISLAHSSPQQIHQPTATYSAPSNYSEMASPVVDTHQTKFNPPANSDRTLSPGLSMSPDPTTAGTSSLASAVLSSDSSATSRTSAGVQEHGLGVSSISGKTNLQSTNIRGATTPPPSLSHNAAHSSPMFIGSPDRAILSPTGGIITTGTSDGDTIGLHSGLSKHKQGLLWAMSRPGGINDQINLNKPGWHKFWVVLGAGKLCEYTNWKQSLDLHNEPINLKMALVREARNAERRFCFEVVTPNYKRVYQATSEEDMHSWIQAINNGISSSLEDSSNSSVKDMPIVDGGSSAGMSTNGGRTQSSNSDAYTHSSIASGLQQGSKSSSDDHSSSKKGMDDLRGELAKLNVRKVSLHRRTSNNKTNTPTSHQSSNSAARNTDSYKAPSNAISGSRIAMLVRGIDSSNSYCADCGTSSKVEWISINLLVILCIECSGVHRSLGSHISKVRSLTLDTVSFTPDLIELLKGVSNSTVNSIWEAKLPRPKVTQRIVEHRLGFIRNKYVDKKYLEEVPKPNALLRSSVKSKDITGILAALASGANPSTQMIDLSDDSIEGEPLVLYSLRHSPPAATVFPIVEALVLNSADIFNIAINSAQVSKLTPGAIQYLKTKTNSREGANSQVAAALNNAAHVASVVPSNTLSPINSANSSLGSTGSSSSSTLVPRQSSSPAQSNSTLQHSLSTGQTSHTHHHAHSNSTSDAYHKPKPSATVTSNSGISSSTYGIYRSRSISGPSASTAYTSVTGSSEKPLSQAGNGSSNSTGNSRTNTSGGSTIRPIKIPNNAPAPIKATISAVNSPPLSGSVPIVSPYVTAIPAPSSVPFISPGFTSTTTALAPSFEEKKEH